MGHRSRAVSGAQAKGNEGGAIGDDRRRTDRIMNSIVNTSIILMSMLMEGFAGAMVQATGAMAAGMVEAVAGEEEGAKVREEANQKQPEVDEKMKQMISEVREDIYAQYEQKRAEIEPQLSDPAFDEGPRIVERYDFGIPRLTEKLDDGSLARYAQLLANEDPEFTKMFQELTGWMDSLPKPPDEGGQP